jgi:hypothetical protein
MKCPHCGKENPSAEQYCLDCGADLAAAPNPATAPAAPNAGISGGDYSATSSAVAGSQAPAAAQGSEDAAAQGGAIDAPTDSLGEPQSESTASGAAYPTVTLDLTGPTGSSQVTVISDDVTVGRRDADDGIYPEVDFEGNDIVVDGGERVHAVSRRHGRIFREGSVLKYEDLGSTNGSTLNGTPVNAHDPQLLSDGDRIILGRTCRIEVHVG